MTDLEKAIELLQKIVDSYRDNVCGEFFEMDASMIIEEEIEPFLNEKKDSTLHQQ